jgi:hypothetical protein
MSASAMATMGGRMLSQLPNPEKAEGSGVSAKEYTPVQPKSIRKIMDRPTMRPNVFTGDRLS